MFTGLHQASEQLIRHHQKMEDGGLVSEAGAWAELGTGGDESEELVAQLLGAFFRSHGEEGRHQLPWSDDQASSDAHGDGSLAVPLGYDGCCGYLSNSDEFPLGSSSRAVPAGGPPDELLGAAETEYLNNVAAANHPFFKWCGNGEGLDGPTSVVGTLGLGSVSAAPNKSKRKHMVEEHDGQTQTQTTRVSQLEPWCSSSCTTSYR